MAGKRDLRKNAQESEKAIEASLVKKAGELGFPCLKYSNPHESGYPDRLVLLPDRSVEWVELKSAGQKPTPLQEARHAALRRMGHRVWVIDSLLKVDEFCHMLRLLYR